MVSIIDPIKRTQEYLDYLKKLDELATNHKPYEKPLLTDNKYYLNASTLEQYLFQVYYAYYGYGKTYGVGLKLYHESLNGELQDKFDVILLNLRNIFTSNNNCRQYETFIKNLKGMNPHTALILTSLYKGVSDFCSPNICRYCYSTLVTRNETNNIKLPYILPPFKENEVAILDKIINSIVKITKRNILLVLDEFESIIGRIAPQDLGPFLYDIGSTLRKLYDKGTKRFGIVILLQKAVFSEAQQKELKESLKESALRGITKFEEIKPYPSQVYARYVVESIKRIDEHFGTDYVKKMETAIRLSSSRRSKILVGLNDEYRIIENLTKEFEKMLKPIENIPPRVAFPLVRGFTIELLEEIEIFLSHIKDRNETIKARDLKKLIHNSFEHYFNRRQIAMDKFTKLYIEYGKGEDLFKNEDIKKHISDIIESILEELIKCEDILSINIQGYKGKICVEKYNEPTISFHIGMARFNEVSRKTNIENLTNSFTKKIFGRIKQYIDSLVYTENAFPEKVIIDPLLIVHHNINNFLIKNALTKAIKETVENLKQEGIKAENIDVFLKKINDEDLILLYFLYLSKKRKHEIDSEDQHIIGYLQERSMELINELKREREGIL